MFVYVCYKIVFFRWISCYTKHTHTQNWIRNRRRPTAARSAEKLVEYISQAGTPISIPPLSVPTVTPIPTISTTVVPVTAIKEISTHQFSVLNKQIQNTSQPAVAVVTGTPTVSLALPHHSAGSPNLGPPEAKKTCVEPSKYSLASLLMLIQHVVQYRGVKLLHDIVSTFLRWPFISLLSLVTC